MAAAPLDEQSRHAAVVSAHRLAGVAESERATDWVALHGAGRRHRRGDSDGAYVVVRAALPPKDHVSAHERHRRMLTARGGLDC